MLDGSLGSCISDPCVNPEFRGLWGLFPIPTSLPVHERAVALHGVPPMTGANEPLSMKGIAWGRGGEAAPLLMNENLTDMIHGHLQISSTPEVADADYFCLLVRLLPHTACLGVAAPRDGAHGSARRLARRGLLLCWRLGPACAPGLCCTRRYTLTCWGLTSGLSCITNTHKQVMPALLSSVVPSDTL